MILIGSFSYLSNKKVLSSTICVAFVLVYRRVFDKPFEFSHHMANLQSLNLNGPQIFVDRQSKQPAPDKVGITVLPQNN